MQGIDEGQLMSPVVVVRGLFALLKKYPSSPELVVIFDYLPVELTLKWGYYLPRELMLEEAVLLANNAVVEKDRLVILIFDRYNPDHS